MATITPDELEHVRDKVFDRVWEFVKACDEREKHFNDLQSGYRTLASTWLLATFGGIGFALSTTPPAGISKELIVGGISVVGALGLALVWVVDVLVYHDLLISGYMAGKQLEEAFGWLPPIRSHFFKKDSRPAVRQYIRAFYTVGIGILCLVGAVILATWGKWLPALIPVVAGLVLIGAIRRATDEALRWKEGLPRWIANPPTESELLGRALEDIRALRRLAVKGSVDALMYQRSEGELDSKLATLAQKVTGPTP